MVGSLLSLPLNSKGAFMKLLPSIDEMLLRIDSLQPNLYGLERAIYSALELLENQTDFDYTIVNEWISDELTIYQENNIKQAEAQAITSAKELVEEQPELFPYFFDQTESEDKFSFPNLDNIHVYFNVPNYDYIETYEELEEYLLLHKDDVLNVPTMIDPKGYEIMASVVLRYVYLSLRYYDRQIQEECYYRYSSAMTRYSLPEFLSMRRERAVSEIINAFLALDKAKELRYQLSFNELEEQIRKKALSTNGRKGGKKRHENSQQIKNEILSKWCEYKEDKENRDKPASKTEFARIMAQEYKISELTIRKNWLQGYEPPERSK